MSNELKQAENQTTHKPLPTEEEVERLVAKEFPTSNAMCPYLCEELQELVDEESDPSIQGKQRARLVMRIHAIAAQIRQRKCSCYLQ